MQTIMPFCCELAMTRHGTHVRNQEMTWHTTGEGVHALEAKESTHVRIAHTRVWVASMRPPRDAAADLTSAWKRAGGRSSV